MSHKVRLGVFLITGTGLLGLFIWAVSGLRPFGNYPGPYGDVLAALTVPELRITNADTAVNFEFRAMDTMGEEYILFASVLGALILLRQLAGEHEESEKEEDVESELKGAAPTDAVRWAGQMLGGVIMLFGMYIVLHAQLTPGGGFQGGAIMATGWLLIYLSGGYVTYSRISPRSLIEVAHASAAGGYVAIGVAGLIVGGIFLRNILPLGTAGHFASGGTIPLINDMVGIEVTFGFAELFLEFIAQTRRPN